MKYTFEKDGEVVSFDNLAKFARSNGLIYNSLQALLCGRIKQHQGWKIPEGTERPVGDKPGRPSQIGIIALMDPDGKIYRDIDNVSQFCEEHGLSRPSIRFLVKGAYTTHRGWRLAPKEETPT